MHIGSASFNQIFNEHREHKHFEQMWKQPYGLTVYIGITKTKWSLKIQVEEQKEKHTYDKRDLHITVKKESIGP